MVFSPWLSCYMIQTIEQLREHAEVWILHDNTLREGREELIEAESDVCTTKASILGALHAQTTAAFVALTRSNIPQCRKQTREPKHPLLGDIDDQPHIQKLSTITNTQRSQKTAQARQDFVTRRTLTTKFLLHNRFNRPIDESQPPEVFTEVLMQLDEGDGDSNNDGSVVELPDDHWEDEVATEEEQLLYFKTKYALQDLNKVIMDQECWDEQMPELVQAYMDYCNRRRLDKSLDDVIKERHIVSVWTVFGRSTQEVPIFVSDTYHNASYIRSGFLPFNPLLNRNLVSLETLELYHNLFMRCPRLGIQPFVRALCDVQGTRFKNNLSIQLSSAYDLYIRLVKATRGKVLKALNHDSPNWRMLNACPSCQYEVESEPELPIRMFLVVDGNNSLKRFQHREPATEQGQVLGAEKERPDNRVGGGDYFLQAEDVDLWDESQWHHWPGWTPRTKSDKVPCADRWSNMNEATTKAKYMLALLHHLMSAMKEDRRCRGLPDTPPGSLAVGYDIACGMVDKIAHSPLSDLARNERLQMLIGLLHGYAHNCLCQLTFLMLYIYGAGIEDLEVCEQYFSQSNTLAPVTRYMGKFRRRQAIANYAYHCDNLETYHNLSRFLYANYKQALGIINRSKEIAKVLQSVGICDLETPIRWLQEEKEYLESRQKTPESKEESLILTERQMANLQEMETKLLLDVQSWEERLGLTTEQRWLSDSAEWKEAKQVVHMAAYHKALDRLEGLIVARIFELSKMNVAGTVREAMSEFFKLVRAEEELDRLHVEIKRLVTYMKDEEGYFTEVVRNIRDVNEALAYQVWRHGMERQHFNQVHRRRLRAIQRLRGFSLSNSHFFDPGLGVRRQCDVTQAAEQRPDDSDSDESEGEDEEAAADDLTDTILNIANDVP
ncbi:hypothetical protein F5050DRAFT_1864634 [Lentinula boryana]|uniref:CxC1-like cysteine cluster associated with KDZ transposases domain-containing protein n=1 Tax=Lentinula boryana TaxID=40481 RepID=A0ABQ8PZ68_9AGAR|nr:hypothetical protein F5050DRAFT_1864634 [Lentinula boryana]